MGGRVAVDFSEIQVRARIFQGVVGKYLRKVFGAEAVIDPMQMNNAIGTQPGGDGGRDFEVQIPAVGAFSLFGVSVRPGSRCYVEVKCVGSGAADFATVSPNLARVQHSPADQVFVVTNAHFAPAAQVDIFEDFRALQDRLHLVEGRAFRHWCEKADLAWPDGIVASVPTEERGIEGLAVEANNLAVREAGGQIQVFSMAFRNLSDKPQAVKVIAASDVEWRFTEQHPFKGGFVELSAPFGTEESAVAKTVVVPPWQSRAIRLSGRFIGDRADPGLQRQPGRGDTEEGARIIAQINGQAVSLFPNLRPLRVCFKPRFVGYRNLALRKRLRPLFEGIERGNRPAALQVIHIDGPAGVGKSRLVDEILPPPAASHVLLLHHTVEVQEDDRPRDERYWSGIRTRLKGRSGLDTGWLKSVIDLPSLIDAVIGPFQLGCDLGKEGAVILVIEDLHNAPEALCKQLLDLAAVDHEIHTHVFLVVTGRNDDSFVNPHYRRFTHSLADIRPGRGVQPIAQYTVKELRRGEARGMVAGLVEGIQPAGIDRILALSGPVPHHIVQCIEFLLDTALVAVTTRDTLSIVDLRTFELRAAELPKSMANLLANRFDNLGCWQGALGQAAQEAVLAATVFGTRFPLDVCALDAVVNAHRVAEELCDRRFFDVVPGAESSLQWHHENLFLFFDRHRRTKAQRLATGEEAHPIAERFADNAALIRANEAVWAGLEPLKQGDIATLIGDLPSARRYFRPIIADANSVQTFNTHDTQAPFFDHIEYVIAAVQGERSKRDKLLSQLIVLKAYIGGYYKGLRFEVEAYDFGMRVLPHLQIEAAAAERCRRWLRTIDAQVHLDSGFVGIALDRLMHLIHMIRLEEVGGQLPESDLDMLFDIHNTFRLLFTYSNFTDLARFNGELATRYRERSRLKRLEDVDLGDLALFHMLTDRKKCIQLLEQALAINPENGGSGRHFKHSEVSLIAARAPDHVEDIEWLVRANARAAEIVAICESEGYHSILPRIHLLRAVLEYLAACATAEPAERERRMDTALVLANRGRNACEAYSIGFISWQISNLRAVIFSRRQASNAALAEIKTALAQMSTEGLLFMGTGGLTSAVPMVLANYIKMPLVRDSDILAILRSLHGFQPHGWSDPQHLRQAKDHARKFHHIITDHERRPDWLLLDDVTDLAVVCWF